MPHTDAAQIVRLSSGSALSSLIGVPRSERALGRPRVLGMRRRNVGAAKENRACWWMLPSMRSCSRSEQDQIR